MCIVSNVGDAFGRRWEQWPYIDSTEPPSGYKIDYNSLTQDELKAFREFIKNDLPELKRLLEMAKELDIFTGQPDCENAEKFAKLRTYAEELGIDPDDIQFIPKD